MHSAVRSYLRAQAHALKPIVMVGKGGLNVAIVSALDEALTSHELVKVKFQAHKDEKREISDALAEQTTSEVVSIIGFIATFYRESENHLIRIPLELLAK